jgi:hypothetical protein
VRKSVQVLFNPCLNHAQEFMWDADHSPADYDENYGRAMACEVLARRIIHQAPRERLVYMMSNRFQTMDWDGKSLAQWICTSAERMP